MNSCWRLAYVVAFNFLFHLVLLLAYQTLVPRSVVIIREKLGQEKIHVGILRILALDNRLTGLITASICDLSEILNVYIIVHLIMWHTVTFFLCLVADALMTLRIVTCLSTTICLEAIVSHAKHLSSEGLRHYLLA